MHNVHNYYENNNFYIIFLYVFCKLFLQFTSCAHVCAILKSYRNKSNGKVVFAALSTITIFKRMATEHVEKI